MKTMRGVLGRMLLAAGILAVPAAAWAADKAAHAACSCCPWCCF